MIQTQALRKVFGRHVAVDDLSFTVPDGVVTGFLGPNGSGKSTSMRLMLGLDRGGGTTLYDGRPLAAAVSASRTVGTHLDAKYFHPRRTARDHLRLLAIESGTGPARVDEVLETFGLAEVADRRPSAFSLGMGQRLGLAGAVLAEPDALILDEPANGLDPQTIHWMRGFLADYAATGRAVFVSSHLLSEIEQMAERVVVIAQGRLVAEGSVTELSAADGHADVLVTTAATDRDAMLDALRRAGFAAEAESPTGVRVPGTDSAAVGAAAFASGLPVLGVQARRASLEQAFLDLTSSAQDFRTGGGRGPRRRRPDTAGGAR